MLSASENPSVILTAVLSTRCGILISQVQGWRPRDAAAPRATQSVVEPGLNLVLPIQNARERWCREAAVSLWTWGSRRGVALRAVWLWQVALNSPILWFFSLPTQQMQ